MNSTRSLILATLALLFSACGGTTEPESTLTAPPAVEQTAKAVETPQKPIEIVAESIDDDTSADNSAPGKIVLAQADSPAAPVPRKFQAKTHYVKLTTAQGTSSPPDVIEVAEVFWYGCQHCFNFDPIVDNWEKDLPDDVNFIRVPVMWNPTNAIHARLFYTLEALGKLDEVHQAIFTEMHVNKKQLVNEAEILNFVVRNGVSGDDFKKTFRSFAVESKLKRAENLTKRYRVQSVPVLVINGKYLTTGDGVKSFSDMLAVADELVAREQRDR